MCQSMVNIQSPTAEIRRGKKRKERRKKKQDENIMVCPITQGDHKYHDNIHGVVIMTKAIARVYPVHLMNAD